MKRPKESKPKTDTHNKIAPEKETPEAKFAPLTMTPREASAMLGVSYHTFLSLIKTNKVRHARLGRQIFVLKEHLLELFNTSPRGDAELGR